MTGAALGIIGHVDHGKTALVRALTGMDTDRLPEERRRGISIALGFAHFAPEPDLPIDLIDMPGHERFVRTMIAGATGIDAVLLVVAANEGIKPQTVEHADIAALLGLRRAVIAISKADLVPPEDAQTAGHAAAALLRDRGIAAAPPMPTAIHDASSLAALRAVITALARAKTPKPADRIPFLPIDRAFSLAGQGTIVTGTLRGGPLATTDEIELLPAARRLRIRSMQIHGERVTRAEPGDRVALNLRDIGSGEIGRGDAIAPAGLVAAPVWIAATLRTVAGAPRLATGAVVRAHIGTAETDARLRLLGRDWLDPGEEGLAQLRLSSPLPALPGEPVLLRAGSPLRAVAGGPIFDTHKTRLPRFAPDALARCATLASLDPAATVPLRLREAGAAGAKLATLARDTGLALPTVARLLERIPVVTLSDGRLVCSDLLAQRMAETETVLRNHEPGLARDALAAHLALPLADIDAILKALLSRGRIRRQGARFFAAGAPAFRAREALAAEAADRIAEALSRAGLTPPEPASLAALPLGREALQSLLRDGTIVRLRDRVQEREILLHRNAIAEAQRRLAPSLRQPPGLKVSEAGRLLGISRKYSVPLLEYLDTIRFTRRVGDHRLLAGGTE